MLYTDDFRVTESHGFRSLVHRYYDPGTGQFLTVDPLINQTGQPYAYVADDPVNNTDPLGLCWPSWACPIENAITGAAKEGAHLATDVVTDRFYLEYWGALDLNGAIHWGLGSVFGTVGCDLANVIGAPLVPLQAQGLGVDIAGDF